jgi:hypothetical protein
LRTITKGEASMLNYTGTGRMDYEDVLRAIGHFIDEHNFKEVCIIELEEGILVRGLVYTANRTGYRTISEAYLFTNEDIDHILEEAYKRRGNTPKTPSSQSTPQPRRGLFGTGR